MNVQVLLVIVSLLINLITGGSLAGNWQPIDYGSQTTSTDAIVEMLPNTGSNNQNYLQMLMLMQMFGGKSNINMSQSNWDQIDKTIDLGEDGWKSYGFGQGSTVRIHGSFSEGVYFDFSVKGTQYEQSQEIVSPIEGLTISTSQYSGSDTGSSFSIGPVNWQTALTLFNYATSKLGG